MISDLDENEESEKAIENFGLRGLDAPTDVHQKVSEQSGSFERDINKDVVVNSQHELALKQASEAKKRRN